jgi:two-component system, cell cycle sensor histidine kinase and response regulator CckA
VASVKASGEYERIYEHWLRPDRSAHYLRILGWVLGAAGLAVLLFIVWNLSLRRLVALQTEVLRQEFEAKEQAKAALARSERILRQSQKMEAIGRVTGGVAHDFNNILTVIVTWASLLREELLSSRGSTAEVDEILVASERASRLTKQLLAFSRATPMEVARVDLCNLVTQLKPMLQRLVGDSVRLETVLPEQAVFVEADPTLLEQILINLAANGRDAMPDGGTLRVSLGSTTLAADNKWFQPPGDYATILVTDTGVGMDEAILGKIFEPFFTTKEVGQGTGLGLATVHANVTKLGGKIAVESALGKGSQFSLVLPRSAAPAAVSEPAAVRGLQARRMGAVTILLVEDDEALRRVARLALERVGYRVLEAKDGEEGEEIARRQAFSVLVTDVVMPKRSGPQLVARLREAMPGLRVLYVSGYVSSPEEIDLRAPRTAYLPKPYVIIDLLEALERLLRREPVEEVQTSRVAI